MIDNFLTTEQVANILQVHPFTILKFIKQGKLNGVKLGRGYRVPESEVKRFLEERMVAPSKGGKKEPDALEKLPAETKEQDKFSLDGTDGEHYYVI